MYAYFLPTEIIVNHSGRRSAPILAYR